MSNRVVTDVNICTRLNQNMLVPAVVEDRDDFYECGTDNGGCEQICRCRNRRPECSCLPGYTLDGTRRCRGRCHTGSQAVRPRTATSEQLSDC